MSAPVDHTGKVFGCFTVFSKAKSRVSPSGGKYAYWNVRCVCGSEREMRAQGLVSRRHVSCSDKKCTERETAPRRVECEICGSEYVVQKRSVRDRNSRKCTKCRAINGGKAVAGKPAPNRLNGDCGGFNLLFGRYKSGAKNRNIEFLLTRDDFRVITKRNCFYCGAEPAQSVSSRKGSAMPYIYNGIDRISSSNPYELGNVVACCSKCNYMKSDMAQDEFLAHISRILENIQ